MVQLTVNRSGALNNPCEKAEDALPWDTGVQRVLLRGVAVPWYSTPWAFFA